MNREMAAMRLAGGAGTVAGAALVDTDSPVWVVLLAGFFVAVPGALHYLGAVPRGDDDE